MSRIHIRLGWTLGATGIGAVAVAALFAGGVSAAAPKNKTADFVKYVHPTLTANCAGCHAPDNPNNPVNFLKVPTAKDMQANRSLWRDVAIQLTNRTMPRGPNKLSEEDRLHLATWITEQLRETACNIGDYAGPAVSRRLNRREYHNTVRDLLGVDFNAADFFPADGSGGNGFDTNGETLYVSPLLIERYVDAAQQIADRVIVSPTLNKVFMPADLGGSGEVRKLDAGQEASVETAVYMPGTYTFLVTFDGNPPTADVLKGLVLKVDGLEAGNFAPPIRYDSDGKPLAVQQGQGRRGPLRVLALTMKLERGTRQITLASKTGSVSVASLALNEQPENVSGEKKALHYRLLGVEPGEAPLNQRAGTEALVTRFITKAYRRSVTKDDVAPLMAVYDRSAERGDPYEERMKLVVRAVLVSPDFLFKKEVHFDKPGIHPLGQQELATRLSYFLWSTAPDDTLRQLADQGKLSDPKVLNAQVDRMLDDPRARAFTTAFVGQWLGTQDLGGRVAPFINSVSSYYNPESAADLRAEPVRMLEYLIANNKSVLDLLDSNYSFLTPQLAKFYQIDDKVKLKGDDFQKVTWPDDRRGGVLGFGAVLALSSNRMQPSAVLRGAWTEETLFGTPVPPPPPNIPPLDANKNLAKASTREKLAAHRSNPVCASCHNLMDPIGLALENFDWIGRWRDKNPDGTVIDAAGSLPSGEKFSGPVELRAALLSKKDDFVRHITDKVLGYALGRSTQDGDSCTVQRISDKLAANGFGARTLVHEVVLSVPFRNSQGGNVVLEKAAPVHKAPEKITPCDQDGTCTPLKNQNVKDAAPPAPPPMPQQKVDAKSDADKLARADAK